MKSKIYNFGGRLFRYDYDNCVVEWLSKADAQTIEDERQWFSKFGEGLFNIDDQGYYIVDSIGLSRCNWDDKESRDEYLWEWSNEINYELQYELDLLRRELI